MENEIKRGSKGLPRGAMNCTKKRHSLSVKDRMNERHLNLSET